MDGLGREVVVRERMAVMMATSEILSRRELVSPSTPGRKSVHPAMMLVGGDDHL
jgi:hypothetical protein